jgi:hypothetical protein
MSIESREKEFADNKRPVTTNKSVIIPLTTAEFMRDLQYWRKRGLHEPIIVQFTETGTKWVSNAAYKAAIAGESGGN